MTRFEDSVGHAGGTTVQDCVIIRWPMYLMENILLEIIDGVVDFTSGDLTSLEATGFTW